MAIGWGSRVPLALFTVTDVSATQRVTVPAVRASRAHPLQTMAAPCDPINVTLAPPVFGEFDVLALIAMTLNVRPLLVDPRCTTSVACVEMRGIAPSDALHCNDDSDTHLVPTAAEPPITVRWVTGMCDMRFPRTVTCWCAVAAMLVTINELGINVTYDRARDNVESLVMAVITVRRIISEPAASLQRTEDSDVHTVA
jgi:hypothetical protein